MCIATGTLLLDVGDAGATATLLEARVERGGVVSWRMPRTNGGLCKEGGLGGSATSTLDVTAALSGNNSTSSSSSYSDTAPT